MLDIVSLTEKLGASAIDISYDVRNHLPFVKITIVYYVDGEQRCYRGSWSPNMISDPMVDMVKVLKERMK